VDEKTAYVKHEKSAKPHENQNNCQDEEHGIATLGEIERRPELSRTIGADFYNHNPP
jgi:hypothetical protein